MMIKLIFTVLLFFTNILYAKIITIDEKTEQLEILSSSQIYIDKTRKLTIDDIVLKDVKFEDNDKEHLSYGYSPDFNVWVKFTVKNVSNRPVQKLLEYGNPLTSHLNLYDIYTAKEQKDGIFQINTNRKSVNPIFLINIEPNQTKVFYLKASSTITTLIIKLKIWEQTFFYNNELKHQAILFLFFGAMFVLAIYNLFIYFFSKDISYLYYVLYIFGVIIHHLFYIGIFYIYIDNKELAPSILAYSAYIVAFPIVLLALFLRSFLRIYEHKTLNKILLSLIVFVIFSIVLSTELLIQYRNLTSMLLLVFLIGLTIYFTYKRNRQAYFILLGWIVIFIAIVLMYLSSIGLFDVYKYFSYVTEIAFITEAIIFAIALSDKINTLKTNLIVQKRTENERLELQVQEKTKDLKLSLEEKTLLLQELNHRVKNNMQMIVSMIRLQTNDIEDQKVQSLFITTQNRLNAMSELHELLYQKEDISYINAYEYFTTLIDGLQETYLQNIKINYIIDTDLETEQAISCGIILNELVTNSLKYAFNKQNQENRYIDIFLSKFQDKYTFIIKDNGSGYDQEKTKKSFGLILVTTLVESKLQGTIDIDSKDGVETIIVWMEDDEND